MTHNKNSSGHTVNSLIEQNNDADSHSSIVYTEEDSDADIQILVSRGYSRELAVIMHKQQVNELKELTRSGSENMVCLAALLPLVSIHLLRVCVECL
jgi:hypothetical protein